MKTLQEKIQFVKDFLSHLPPVELADIKFEDIKYGVVDTFLLSKIKPDKNGIHSNAALIQMKFDTAEKFFKYAKENFSSEYALKSKTPVAYRLLNDNYHFKLIKAFNIKKPEDWDKYAILF